MQTFELQLIKNGVTYIFFHAKTDVKFSISLKVLRYKMLTIVSKNLKIGHGQN